MKTLLLLFITTISYADDLIQVPKDAIISTTGPTTGAITNTSNGDIGPGNLPNSDNVNDYINWANDFFYRAKKAAMRETALKTIMKPNCLPYLAAFGYKKNSATDFQVNCFAGEKDVPSHVMNFNMRVTFKPEGCDAEAKIREHFNFKQNRSATEAQKYYDFASRNCFPLAVHTNFSQPVTGFAIDPTKFLDNPQFKELQKQIEEKNGGKKTTAPAPKTVFPASGTNILKPNNPLKKSTKEEDCPDC